MIALAHRADDFPVNALLRAFKRVRRAFRRPWASNPRSTCGECDTAARSERRNQPRCPATRPSTRSSSGVVRTRVLIATPAGTATGFTPRHRRRTEPTTTPSHTPPTTNPDQQNHQLFSTRWESETLPQRYAGTTAVISTGTQATAAGKRRPVGVRRLG